MYLASQSALNCVILMAIFKVGKLVKQFPPPPPFSILCVILKCAFLGHRGVREGARVTPYSDSMGTILTVKLVKMM